MRRVACYVDGFNLYHAVHDLNKPHLKWLDLIALAQSLCRPQEQLVKVAYFSAYATWLPAAYARHREYVKALRHLGVECHIAGFSEKAARCHTCGATWKQHEEKETDVHFSLTLLEDAVDDVFDRAILISAQRFSTSCASCAAQTTGQGAVCGNAAWQARPCARARKRVQFKHGDHTGTHSELFASRECVRWSGCGHCHKASRL